MIYPQKKLRGKTSHLSVAVAQHLRIWPKVAVIRSKASLILTCEPATGAKFSKQPHETS